MQMFDEHPLLLPVVGLLGGVSTGLYWLWSVSWWWVFLAALFLTLAAFWGAVLCFRVVLLLFCFCLGVAAMGPLVTALERPLFVGTPSVSGELIVEGIVFRRPLELPQGQRFELQLERMITPQGELVVQDIVLVTITTGRGTWLPGDRIRVQGTLRRPQPLGLPGEFDYARYLAVRGIAATFLVKDVDHVVVMRAAARPSWFRFLDHAAQRCNQTIRQSVPDPAAAAVLMALVTGSQAGIPSDLSTAYARAGVSHILSISGFHVAILAAAVGQGLLFLLLRWEWLTLRWNLRRNVLLATLPCMAGYLLFTGGAPATARAVVMLAAVVLALWVERESEVLDALLLAALLLVLMTPSVLFDLSFQLSFLSLWGIVILTPLFLAPLKDRLVGWRHLVALFFASSLSAIMATSVATLASFHQASLTGVLANLVVVPLLGYGAVLLGAVAASLVFAFPWLATKLFALTGWLVELSNHFVIWVAKLPVLRSYQVGTFDLAMSVAVLAVLSFVVSRRMRGGLIAGLVVITLLVHLWPATSADGVLRLTFLSVGQGDATLVQFPDGSTMLIDGGGYLRDTGHDFGERYLVPALYRLGINRIDRMVLTHPHPDHMGGLPAVVEQFPVGEFWQGPWRAADGGDYARLQKSLKHQGVPIRQFTGRSQPVRFGSSLITVLASADAGMPVHWDGETGNEASLVFRLEYGRFSALFMADAGQQTEQQLLQQGLMATTLLKVGHHGSRSASSKPFVNQTRPQLAVISVGAANRFGLPAPETLTCLKQHGAQVYRTDQDGTIQVQSDGVNYWVTTNLSRR